MNDSLLKEFLKTVERKQAVITLQVYLELCEIKKYYDVNYSFSDSLNKITITAAKTKNGPSCMFVPIRVNENINFLGMYNVLHYAPDKIVYLVIVHSDSTCVYYQIADGLLEPIDTTPKHLKENKQEKLDRDLKKHRDILEQAALFGLPINLPDAMGYA